MLLSLDGLSKSFGSLKVTDDITLDVPEGQALGVLGPNGAGKTTLFNLISGDLWPDRGGVLFQGENVTRLLPHQRCRKGIGRTYQIPHPFIGMTVFENLLVAATHGAALHEHEAYSVVCGRTRANGTQEKGKRAGRVADLAGSQATRTGEGACHSAQIAAARRDRRRAHRPRGP